MAGGFCHCAHHQHANVSCTEPLPGLPQQWVESRSDRFYAANLRLTLPPSPSRSDRNCTNAYPTLGCGYRLGNKFRGAEKSCDQCTRLCRILTIEQLNASDLDRCPLQRQTSFSRQLTVVILSAFHRIRQIEFDFGIRAGGMASPRDRG